ncbi:MAG: DUF5119 domain-containing protein [Bacteroidaceae bacterium]|nr:DUF5119 domain-containing protein [Bacteroidaceae bacterium]
MNRRVNTFMAFLMTLILLTSCELRPLSDLNKNLLLRLRINLQILNVTEPPQVEVMRVIFYDPKTNRRFTEDYVPSEGGYISVPPGDYKLIIYNFDTESTLIRNDAQLYQIEAYTNEISQQLKNKALSVISKSKAEIEKGAAQRRANTRAGDEVEVDTISDEDKEWAESMDGLENAKIVYEPDHLFVARDNVTILNDVEEQVVEVEAETVVETYYLSVRVKNIKHMASANALLTGQIGSNFIAYPKEEGKSDDNVSLYFPLYAGSDAAENDMVHSTFNTFGKLPGKETKLWLTIFLTTQSGQTVEWHKDITDEFMNNPEHKIIIEEDAIIVPDPPAGSGGGGFQPGVSEWEEEHHYIDL